jgi:hypothetical protein
MNFDQAKALRLQQWRSTLNDHDFRMQNPEAHRQHLHSMASTLVVEGLIDTLEQYDMNEMANAAYWHAVEELQSHPVRYCGASTYDVVARDGSLTLGEIRQTIFNAKRGNQDEVRTTYDGKVYRDGSGAKLVFNPSGASACIEGLTLTLHDGRQFDLIQLCLRQSAYRVLALSDWDRHQRLSHDERPLGLDEQPSTNGWESAHHCALGGLAIRLAPPGGFHTIQCYGGSINCVGAAALGDGKTPLYRRQLNLGLPLRSV